MDIAALQHSVFLQALGSAILNSLWQCFILWLLYETISASYKSASARFKNNLATLFLFCSFAWFLAGLAYKIFNEQNVASVAADPTGFTLESSSTIHAVSGFTAFLSYASRSLPYLSVAYIFLLFFLTSRLFLAYRYVYLISNKRLINPSVQLQLFASKVAREIGITKKISVWITHHIDVPATIGFIKPVILIPLASINNLSCQQLEAIILHELAHIKRNDYITNLLISVIETILFFNPFIVLLSNIIKRERENCCDDFVLQYRYDPHSYASALLRLEQSRMSKLKLAIGAVSGKKQLLSRIKRITNSQVISRQFNYGQKMVALLLITVFICSVAWLSPGEKKPVSIKALAKKSGSVPLSKTKLINEVPRVIASGKPGGNLPAGIGIKHLNAKNQPALLAESDPENFSSNNYFSEDDQNNENPAFKVEDNTDAEATNLKQPGFFFDANNLKLLSLTEIQNFLSQNMNLNIDFSKADMGQLNENLKKAYKQFNAVDWSKVQNEIRKSMPALKLSGLSKKEQGAFCVEKAKALSQFNLMRAQHQYDSKAFTGGQVKKEMLLQDSLHNNAEWALLNEINTNVQQTYKKMQRQHVRNSGDDNNYYFNYSNNNSAVADDGNEEAKAESQKDNPAPNSCEKTIKISVKRIPKHLRVWNEKTPLQFSFNRDDEKSNHENVISVEVTNLP